jgi:hypothetical protein
MTNFNSILVLSMDGKTESQKHGLQHLCDVLVSAKCQQRSQNKDITHAQMP